MKDLFKNAGQSKDDASRVLASRSWINSTLMWMHFYSLLLSVESEECSANLHSGWNFPRFKILCFATSDPHKTLLFFNSLT